MSLVRFNQRNAFPSVFDGFFNENYKGFAKEEKAFSPATNVKENDTSYELDVSLPGFDKKDIKLEVSNDILTISSEHSDSKKDENEKFTRKEFSFRNYSRSFTLPEGTKEDDIKADYMNGILKIEIPKVDVKVLEKAKEIKIK